MPALDPPLLSRTRPVRQWRPPTVLGVGTTLAVLLQAMMLRTQPTEGLERVDRMVAL